MRCFFCDSVKHLTQYCDVYTSVKSRKEVASSKDCCPYCLKSAHHSSTLSTRCVLSSKCYICFTEYHSTLYCPNSLLYPSLHVPKIDTDLLSRFFQMLVLHEQYKIAFESPTALRLAESCFPLKQLKILNKMEIFGMKNIYHLTSHLNCNTLTSNKIWFHSVDSSYEKLKHHFQNISNKIWTFHAKEVELSFSKFSTLEFLLLLSIYTKELKCMYVTVTPKVKFSEIIRKTPNAINIELSQMEIEFEEETWLTDLRKYLSEESLKRIMIKTDKFKFNGNVEDML